jgi:hypothetical protein
MRVYKYTLGGRDEETINMPKGARIIHCAMQNEHPQLWAIVDPDLQPAERRTFYIRGTGHDLPKNDRYDPAVLTHIGTFLMHAGAFVFHVFEFQLPEGD